MAISKLNIYFPVNNLNPQGWISEFITPIISKTGVVRSDEANLFYDSIISPQNIDNLKKAGFKDEEIEKLKTLRSQVEDEKQIFLNGNFYDILEVDSNYRDNALNEPDKALYFQFMNSIKPYQQAFLQSYMKLQYGYKTPDNPNQWNWVDFPFTQKFDLDYILGPGRPRVEGSGITSVSVQNIFNLATQINSAIDIGFFFGSLHLLTQEMDEKGNPIEKKNSPFPYGFSFAKLVSNMDTTKETIRLEYGRKVAPGFENVFGRDAKELKNIIEEKEKKVILMFKTSQDLTFEADGRVTINASYQNYHDVKMKSPNNIAIPSNTPKNKQLLRLPENYGSLLDSYELLIKELKDLDEKITQLKKAQETATVDKKNSEVKNLQIEDLSAKRTEVNKNINLIKRSIKPTLTTVLLDKIKSQGQLFGIKFNSKKDEQQFLVNCEIFMVNPNSIGEGDFKTVFTYPTQKYDVGSYLKGKKFPTLFNGSELAKAELLTRIYARIFNSPYDDEAQDNKKYGHIMFFPIKALISAGYSFLEEEEKKEIPHMLLGSVLMKVGNNFCSINIGDLLVETTVFQKWYYERFIKKDRLEYAFGNFVTDIMTELVPEVLYRNRVGFDDKAPTTAIKEIQYYLKAEPSQQLKSDVYWTDNKDKLKELGNLIFRNPPITNIKPLIYYGQLNNQTTQIPSPLFSNLGVSEFNFDEVADAQKGITHIKIGADGGFFTKVNFNKQDFNLIRSTMAFEALASNASRYFFYYYQLGLEMMGNNIFNYDSVVCIPSNPLGVDTQENDIGIVGYYKVKSTNDNLDSDNNYTTTATADWVFNPRYLNKDKTKDPDVPYSGVVIRDVLDASVNNPENYVLELLENDPNTVINTQAQNMNPPEKKTKEKVKKDEKKEKKKTMSFDIKEEFK